MSQSTPEVIENRDEFLNDWIVEYGESRLLFECRAENINHAIEQAQNAYPDEVIAAARIGKTDIATVYSWDSDHYGEALPNCEKFLMSVIDQRRSCGRMFIDIGPDEDMFDVMSLSLEINRLPETSQALQCVHVHFDSDNLAFSLFKQGNKYVVRPEVGVTIKSTILADGISALILE